MNNNIAVLVDTGSDISIEMAKKFGIYLLPLYINLNGKSLKDRFEVTDMTSLYEEMEREMPKTSTPSIGEIQEMLARIKADGKDKVIVINISTALSGVCNAVKLAAKDIDDMEIEVIDSKDIAIGTGFLGVYASELVRAGESFEDIVSKVKTKIYDSRVIFTVDTLKYLIKGGRIGKVSGTVGNLLNIKPIICCNEDGVYITLDKLRGIKKTKARMVELAKEFLGDCSDYYICFSHGGNEKDIADIKEALSEISSKAKYVFEGQISATLSIHTGAGLVGIGIFKLN